MPEIVLVPKEETHGSYGCFDFGSSIRVFARSPDKALFNARGLQLHLRGRRDAGGLITLIDQKVTKALLIEAIPKIDEAIGAGVGAAVVEAWGKHKTVLVDGGGAPLPLPNHKAHLVRKAAFEAATSDFSADLTGLIGTCKQCGANLRPRTSHHRMGHVIQEGHPRSAEDCQKLTNYQVVATHDYGMRHPEKIGYVEWFETWDGAAVWDEDFCDDKCAALFGRRAAQAGVELTVGGQPKRVEWFPREDHDHFDVEAAERRREAEIGRMFPGSAPLPPNFKV